jgi:hypothetical protein
VITEGQSEEHRQDHGGGDFQIFGDLVKGTLKNNDSLGVFASAGDGVASMIIGAAT